MKKILFTMLFIMASPAYTAMYKWTDEQGNIHYGERPPNRQQAQNISPPPPPASSSSESSGRVKSLRKGILKQTEDAQKAKDKAQKKSVEDKKKREYCEQLRQRFATFKSKARIRQQGKDGSYSYLGDDQKQKQEEEMQQRLAKDCS